MRAALAAATSRLEHAARDLDRARAVLRDAAEAERRLAAEEESLATADIDAATRLDAAEAALQIGSRSRARGRLGVPGGA